MELASYRRHNQAYKDKLVFHLGTDAGFFSEYNNMVLAMAWCLENHVQFRLFSRDAWFGELGWETFFGPFCREETAGIHRLINTRMGGPKSFWAARVLTRYYKLMHPRTRLTYEVWRNIRHRDWEQHHYDFPAINFQGNLQSLCRALTTMIWVYNHQTRQAIDQLINELHISTPYLGVHVRAGDKYQEDQLHPVSAYLESLSAFSDIRRAFVLIDDYAALQQARKDFPDWELHSLCEPDEAGYYHQVFMRQPPEFIHRKMLRLFASMEILKDAEYFMGTFSSNPGMFMGMRKEPERCLGVDGSNWCIW